MQLKVYRKDNRKKDRGRWRRYLMQFGVLVVLLLVGLMLYRLSGPILIAAVSLRDFVVENPYFSVREIQVRGGEKVSGNEIVTFAGLRQGMNILKIDPADIEKKIAKHPWVRRVLVHREFPRRITIDVEERTPKAIVAVRKLYYLDADGVLFKEVEPGDNMNFPMLTGLSAQQLTAPDQSMRKRIQEAVRLGEQMARRSFLLSEIHFDAPDRLVVYTSGRPVALRMGWGDWDDKLARLERLLALWKGHEERLASLDLSFRDQVVARLRRAEINGGGSG
jgi:cell division protein FtsQ